MKTYLTELKKKANSHFLKPNEKKLFAFATINIIDFSKAHYVEFYVFIKLSNTQKDGQK